MKKIFLFCGNGMSTSMLASKMQASANEHSLPIEVRAYPYHKLVEIMASDPPDCILLGPQVKYLYEKTVEDYGQRQIPIAVVHGDDYGMMRDKKILKEAVDLIKAAKKSG